MVLKHPTPQGSCCCTRHPDVDGSPLACTFPDRFGFGSVHDLRDFGDTVKLVHAMGRVEADGQVGWMMRLYVNESILV